MSGKRIIYFDSCIFISLLTGELRPNPDDMSGVIELMKEIDAGSLSMATSVLSISEILDGTIKGNSHDDFEDIFQRKNCFLVDVDKNISKLSSEIRNYYIPESRTKGIKTLATPDAIHIATAINFGCSEFYTFDELQKPNKPMALIPISQPIAGQYKLQIFKPKRTESQTEMKFP